ILAACSLLLLHQSYTLLLDNFMLLYSWCKNSKTLMVRINATGDTIVLKFIRPHEDTKLEGYILGYGKSMFSKQYIQLPENGEAYETEIEAEPKYLIAVKSVKANEVKKPCPEKVNLEKPLHLVIGSVTPTSVLLSWGTLLKTPYTDTQLDDCLEESLFTVRYREEEPNKHWNYQTCPGTSTVIDNLKPDTQYEFGVREDNNGWTHSTASSIHTPTSQSPSKTTDTFQPQQSTISPPSTTTQQQQRTTQQQQPTTQYTTSTTETQPSTSTTTTQVTTTEPPSSTTESRPSTTETTGQLKSTTDLPQTSTTQPQPITAQQKLNTVQSQPITTEPQSTTTQTQLILTQPKPRTSQPQPSPTQPKTTQSQPSPTQPTTTQPQLILTQAKPRTTQSQSSPTQPRTTQSQNIVTQAKPRATQSQPLPTQHRTTQLQSIVTQPKPRTTQSQPSPTQPKTTQTSPTQPKTTQPQPLPTQPRTTQSQPILTQPKSRKNQPQPSPTQLKTTQPSPTEPKTTQTSPTEPKTTQTSPTQPKTTTQPSPTQPTTTQSLRILTQPKSQYQLSPTQTKSTQTSPTQTKSTQTTTIQSQRSTTHQKPRTTQTPSTTPHVIYKTDKPPEQPCSVTDSLSYFPEEEAMNINVTGPPKNAPSNLTVVTVEGCPSFVILDWEKTDNETTEYEVTSSTKGPKGKEVSLITTNQTHTAVENLKPESNYEFTVTPKNDLGSGPSSEPVKFSTESVDPRVTDIPTGKNAIWSSFPFKAADSYSECIGRMFVKRTWYRKYVGIQLCNSLRYKIYLSDSLKGKFYNIGDQTGNGEDHCQFVDSFLDGRTGGPLSPNRLPPKDGFFRAVRQEPVQFGQIGGNTHINYVAWYECGVPIPGSW
uniref:ABI family, member 3 (NESH) binding protein a n=2 Tax=Astyanax mexicanus TaxID=7994 RepID=A0A8B9GLP0_ASTMX